MSGREVYAALFLQAPGDGDDPLDWASRTLAGIGVETWGDDDPWADSGDPEVREFRYARWAGQLCTVEVVPAAPYRILLLIFDDDKVLVRGVSGGAAGVGDDGAGAVAEAFRSACEALRPEVAFVESISAESAAEDVLAYVDHVRRHDVGGLVRLGLGLVYVRDPGAALDQAIAGRSRDELAVAEGRLVFAGAGPYRWWGSGR